MKRITLTTLLLLFVGSLFAQYDSYYYPLWWVGAYPDNATITCYLYIDGELQDGTNWEIGAYNMDPVAIAYYDDHGYTNICGRGVAQQSEYVEHTFYQVTYSADAGMLINFKLYNHTTGEEGEMEYVTPLAINFVSNASLGSVSAPYELHFYSQGENMVFTGQGDWNDLENWQDIDRLPMSLDNVTIADGAICQMPESAVGQYATLTIADGGQLYAPEDAEIVATVQKNIEAYDAALMNNWYLLSIPVDVENEEPFEYESAGMLEGNYDFFYFDQNFPGTLEESEDNGEWRNYKYYMENGQPFVNPYNGYLYANASNTTLNFTGLLYTASNKVYQKINHNEDVDQVGVNLIGNPYTCNAEMTTANRISGIFMMNDDRDDVIVYDDGDFDYTAVAPMTSFFAVATQFHNNAKVTMSPVDLEEHEDDVPGIIRSNVPSLKMELTANGIVKDRIYVKAGEGDNCIKFNLRNEGTKLYVPQDGKNYAIAYTNDANVMPVSFRTAENGTYTLNFNTRNYSYLHLIDYMTGADVDLLSTSSYTFDANTSDYTTRFKLIFSEDAINEIADSFAYMSNGNLMINNNGEATLQVMDITGRILSSENIQDCYSKSLNMSAGVYVIRLINGANVKAQKIVVE